MKIDTERVIFAVQSRRCLWDKNNELYRNRSNRTSRDAAWLEICEELVPGFQTLNKNEKFEIERKIHQRWRTARDTYKKDKLYELKTAGSGAKKRSKYAYYNIMTFLDSVIDNTDDVPEFLDSAMTPSTTDTPPPASATPHQSIGTTSIAHQSAPTTREENMKQPSEFEKKLLECLHSNQLQLESEDLAFFQSLQPTLKKFTNYQKMLFRSKVLQILMDMEQPKAEINYLPSNISGYTSHSDYNSTPSPHDFQREIPVTRSYDVTVTEDESNMLSPQVLIKKE